MPDDCSRDRCALCIGHHATSRCPHKCICGVGGTHNINGCPNICDCGQGRPHMPDDCPQDRCELCNGRNHRATMCPQKCDCNIGSLHNINACPNMCGCGETPAHSIMNCRFVMHLTLLSEVPMLASQIVLALLIMWCLTLFFFWTEIPSNTRKGSRKCMSTVSYQPSYAQGLSRDKL
jgi:hypothetical protein